jgi:hypothetical protein
VDEEAKVNTGGEVEINKLILKRVILISLDLLHIKALGEVNQDGEEIQKEEKGEVGEKDMLKKLIQKLKRHL